LIVLSHWSIADKCSVLLPNNFVLSLL
jgi:hypothetical protein